MIIRRLTLFALLIAALFALFVRGAGNQPPANRRPNILVILADDVGWNDVGFHGSEIKTPNLDRIAREGVELRQFYVHPTCSPTRAAFLTGRNPGRFGILTPLGTRDARTLPKDTVTLARLLREAGYATALIGKWHLGWRTKDGPRQYGFDFSYGMLHGAVDKYTHRTRNGDLTWHRNDHLLEEAGHADDLITGEALRYLQRRDRSKPFFLYVPFGHAHVPLQEEEKWIAPYRKTIENESRRLFAASVTHLDDNVGRLLAALRAEGLRDNTLVVFFSDNGGQQKHLWSRAEENYGGKFADNDRLGNNAPLRGWKEEVYEGGIRVPAILHWPGTLKPARVEQVVSVNDLLPTLSGLAGVAAPRELDGCDVWPFAIGNARNAERVLYWQMPRQLALRKGDWKLVRDGAESEQGRGELFNLAADPNETNDLAKIEAAKLAELQRELQRLLQTKRRQ